MSLEKLPRVSNVTSRNRILMWMFAALVWQSCALAGLGSDIHSVAVDREAMHGGLQSASTQLFSLHTITTEAGTTINEYATPQGAIFAVTWRGSMPPDLQQLFGTYYDQYQSAAADAASAHPGDHRHLNISTADLVVQAVGRPRYYHGRAFVRSLIPAGVSLDALQ
jgi:hypothetical protein